MNIFSILIPKGNLTYINCEDFLNDAVECLMVSGYTAVPVIDDKGCYFGIIAEGDFLRVIMEQGKESLETLKVGDIIKRDTEGFVLNTVSKEEVYEKILDRNFLSVVDDRSCFIGMITRKSVILDLNPSHINN